MESSNFMEGSKGGPIACLDQKNEDRDLKPL